MTLEDIFPAFGLGISCGVLRLDGLRTEDIPAVTEVAVGGIHGPDFLPFLLPWSEAAEDELPRNAAQFYWDSFASFGPERWHLNLVSGGRTRSSACRMFSLAPTSARRGR